jgi:hypothetical protein
MFHDITTLFNPDLILINLGTVNLNGKQVYYTEQASNFVPFPAGQAASYVPAQFIGLTNEQLWSQFGLALGGIVAPPNATTVPGINGVVSDPANYLPTLKLQSRKYESQLQGYQLSYLIAGVGNAAPTLVVDPQVVNLVPGWNVITRVIGGVNRSFLVYGDVTPPTFQINPKLVLKINPLDLSYGFTITGTILDDSFGSMDYHHRFTGLDKLPIQTAADGSKFITITFTISDFAGNQTKVSINVIVDPSYPLQGQLHQKHHAPRTLSPTLMSLLGFIDQRPVNPITGLPTNG